MKKTLWTLNINNYEPEITALTFPLMQMYATKIGAEFRIITEKKLTLPGACMEGGFPGLEKFQLYELGRDSDWNIFIDPDALVHPDFFDVTALMHKDTTAAYATSDFVPIRFRPDKYFLRDGRMQGKGNWFAVASDWCLDYWHPLDDIPLAEAQTMCFPTLQERTCHKPMSGFNMVEDWLVSRNIARYGLKHLLIPQILAPYGFPINYIPSGSVATPQGMANTMSGPIFHVYQQTGEEKVIMMQNQLKAWGLEVKTVTLPAEVKSEANSA